MVAKLFHGTPEPVLINSSNRIFHYGCELNKYFSNKIKSLKADSVPSLLCVYCEWNIAKCVLHVNQH
jgi:hypothetical protein